MLESVAETDRRHDMVEPLLIVVGARQVHRQSDVLDGAEGGDQVEGLEDKTDAVPSQLGQLTFV